MNTDVLLIEKFLLDVNVFWSEQKFFEGRKCLEEVLFLDPLNGQAHSFLGWYYYAKLQDFDRAAKHYEIAIRERPDIGGSYINYSTVLFETKNYTRMIEIAEQGLSRSGGEECHLLNDVGRACEMLGDYKRAKEMYQKALDRSMDDYAAGVIRGNIKRIKIKIGRNGPLAFFY